MHVHTEIQERRVLQCLRDYRRKTLEDITKEYNQKYPPTFALKIVGIKVTQKEIQPALMLLVENGLVEEQLLSFTNRPLLIPVKYYSLTKKGIQHLNTKR